MAEHGENNKAKSCGINLSNVLRCIWVSKKECLVRMFAENKGKIVVTEVAIRDNCVGVICYLFWLLEMGTETTGSYFKL